MRQPERLMNSWKGSTTASRRVLGATMVDSGSLISQGHRDAAAA